MSNTNLDDEHPAPGVGQTDIDIRLEQITRELGERPELYNTFGHWWWLVKRELQKRSRRWHWFTRGYCDRAILEAVVPTHAPEARRQQMEKALAYQEAEAADGEPYPEIHILDIASGARVYRVQDPDAGRQLDLFEEVENRQRRREAFLERTDRYLPTPWLQRGDDQLAEGNSDRAVACYKRALAVAHEPESLLNGWLKIGTVYQERGEQRKAIVAYEQAYQRGKEAWILGMIGQALLEAGRPGEAAQRFRGALESMPGNPEYRAGLERAQAHLAEQERGLAISS